MLEQVANALDRQDYQTAQKLITTLVADRPDDHQVQLYLAQLQEATNKLPDALEIYRRLLLQAVNIKIVADARRGIQRIEQIQLHDRATDLAGARAEIKANPAPGFLILEPIEPDHKQAAFRQFAEIMNLDAYSARLQLPSRGWRLYKVGQMGELEFYRDQLQQAQIPCFTVSQQDTQQIFVFQVSHFQSFHPQARVVCQDDRAELRTFNFDWSEVTQIVTGLLPIFEEVVEFYSGNQTRRKTKTLDYVHVCDLHLADRRSIFRLCSQTYDFCDYKQLITQNHGQTGAFSSELSGDLGGLLNGQRIPVTSRNNWKNLMSQIREQIAEVPDQHSFTTFAETAIGFPEMLRHIDPHIELLRRADSNWDRAFQLYSTLSLCKIKG